MSFIKGKIKTQSGYTLVELMVAIMMSGVVMSSIFVIVSGSHKYIITGRKTLELQQDFSLIETVLASNIRQSVGGRQQIFSDYSDYNNGGAQDESGSCLKLRFGSGDSVVAYLDGNDFKILNSDLSVTTLIQGTVTDLMFTSGSNSILTDLVLSQNNRSIENTFVDAFRDFETISDGSVYTIYNRLSGKYLDVDGGSLSNGASIIQWDYHGGTNQQWRVDATGDGYYTLTAQNSGKLLDVADASTADGANVIQWSANGGANQKWAIELQNSGFYKLTARHSGKCLDVENASTANGANVLQWTDNGGASQRWQFVLVGG